MRRQLAICLALCLALTGCAGQGASPAPSASPEAGLSQGEGADAPAVEGLVFQSELEREYAQCFRVFCYEGGYRVITVTDGRRYLVVPEDGQVPQTEGYVVICQPLDNIYLVASAAMSLFCAVDGLECIRLSGTKQEGWYVEQAAQAMAEGEIVYAGKYSAPDYELLISEHCDLAVESTMIYHTPEVQEKIEELGIPVFIERSSYEPHPLGRTEWVKAYAALLGREEQARQVFQAQKQVLEDLTGFVNTEKTVAFFYVTTSGTVSVRKSSDYLAKMIELAGGRYIFPELGDPDSTSSSVNMTMEEFYAGAKGADYLIYNATIADPVDSLDELLAKSDLFAEFKAVQEGNVWCTGRYLYQATDILGGMVEDIHIMLTDETGKSELTFMNKLS